MTTGKSVARNWKKILILLPCVAFATAVTWYNFRGGGEHSGLLTAVLFLIIYGLFNTGIIELPAGSSIPFLTVWPKLSDAVKSAVCFMLIFLWTPIGMRLTPDTPMGVAVLLIPDAFFLVAAFVFLSNGLSRNLK